jgi:hypothetical protein
VGWLIVHTENKKAETFNLYGGINYIGRKKKTTVQIILFWMIHLLVVRMLL